MSNEKKMKVAVVGGGIAGLATAYYLQEHARRQNKTVEYVLVESCPNLGGKIVSAREQGFVVEGGPDSFITQKTSALELCRALGLGNDLIGTNDVARQVFVWSRGKLRMMPEGVMLIIPTRIGPFVKSSLVSWPGKLRMGMDVFIPPRRDNGDESLAHFVRRRLGAEALDRIAEPMIAGIYVADAEDLSLRSTFPRFLDMEQKYGSLLRGVLAQKRVPNPPAPRSSTSMFMTLRGGLQELVEALAAQLDPASVLLNRSVVKVTREEAGYGLVLSGGEHTRADALVLATPAYTSADLIEPIDSKLASSLRSIRYVSTATVSLGYRRDEVGHSLQGFGFVVPRSEKRKIIACTWSSTKFDYRAPEGHVLVRTFIGGAQAEHLAEQDAGVLAQMAREELRAMMGITATPVLTKVYRWSKANPQYAVGHQGRIEQLDRAVSGHRGLYLVGSAYRGVGIPDCIQDGMRTADQILDGTGGEH